MERYEAYKDTGVEWIGEIPEEWDIKRLKAVLIERKEKNNPAKTDFILSLTNTDGVIPYSEKGDKGNKAKEDITDYFLAYPDDIVLNSMNVVIGSVGLSQYFGAVSPVYYMLRPRKSTDCVRFFNYLFQSSTLQNALKGLGNGILEIRMRIPMGKLNNVMLPIPCGEQQVAIADYLDARTAEIDKLVADCEREVGLLREYRKVVISEAVTKGLDPDAPMKESGVEWIGEIPEGWKCCRVKQVAYISSGATPKRDNYSYWNGTIPWVKTGELQNALISESEECITETALDETSVQLYPAGTILMAMYGQGKTRGMTGMLAMASTTNQACAAIQVYTSDESMFIWKALIAGYDAIRDVALGSGQPNLNAELVSNFHIPLPNSVEEQRRIVAVLDAKTAKIDSLIEAKQAMAEKLREYRRSLISEAVTGKFKVPGV